MNTETKNPMNWIITVSGACPTFKGLEILAEFASAITHKEAMKKRAEIEKSTGRIAYLSRRADLR